MFTIIPQKTTLFDHDSIVIYIIICYNFIIIIYIIYINQQ